MGKRAVGDEDGGAGADSESDNGAQLGVKVSDDGLELGGGLAEP